MMSLFKKDKEEPEVIAPKPVTCRSLTHKQCEASTATFSLFGTKVDGKFVLRVSHRSMYASLHNWITLNSMVEAEDLANKILEMTTRLGAGDE